MSLLVVVATCLGTTVAPPRPLEERVREAEAVFVGKLINRVEEGDWVRADLLVEEPLAKAEKDAKIQVIWRKTVAGQPIYDAPEGARGVAILEYKHEGRYWLRSDTFEDMDKLEQVKAILAQQAKP